MIVQNYVSIIGNELTIKGQKFQIPYKVLKHGNSQTVINGKVYINGYEFKNGKFKRTLKALWHWLF